MTGSGSTAQDRLASIDVLRGLIMVVMALDHVGLMVGRFHSQEMWAGAWTRYSSALPFLTRFVTHFCAPGFFLLMGAGVALMADARARAGWSTGRIARHVLVRGALLIVVATLPRSAGLPRGDAERALADQHGSGARHSRHDAAAVGAHGALRAGRVDDASARSSCAPGRGSGPSWPPRRCSRRPSPRRARINSPRCSACRARC